MSLQQSEFNMLVLRVLMLCTTIRLTCSQSFRSIEDYHFNIQIGKDENLSDTGILPDGEDVHIYLFKNEPKSFFFPLEGPDTSSVSITVVPCSSIIEWKVFHHPQGPDKRNTLEDDPLFLQQNSFSRHPSATKAPSSLDARYLHTFQGRDMSTFKTVGHLSNGVLRIVLVSTEKNSKVQLYATSAPQGELAFPLAPSTPGIDIVSNDRASVTVAWKPTPSHVLLGQKIKYCVAFNPRQNYRTLCALKADLEGEPPPPWPKYAGFGFAWEETTKRRISSLRKSIYKSMRPRRDIHFECVGARHWATVTTLLADRQYFVNVFAVNEFTNRSLTYAGASFVTSQRAVQPLRAAALRPGIVHNLRVGGSSGPRNVYTFELKTYAKKLNLFLQGCSRQVLADVIYEGAVAVPDLPVVGFRKITLRHADVGNYSVRLSTPEDGEGGEEHKVKLCYTGKIRKCPYNGVPSDLHLNATAHVASCRSVSFRWTSADSHAKYCFYKRQLEGAEYGDDYGATADEKCYLSPAAEQFEGHEKVFCRHYKKNSPQRNGKYISETVWDLTADGIYEFRLQGILRQGIVVDYEPVVVAIGAKCN